MENQKEFRIVEDVKGFYIQKKTEVEVVLGKWFWKKTKTEVRWLNVDKYGEIVSWCLGVPLEEVKVYAALERANLAIEKFKKYPIYHYEVQEPQFTKREIHGFCETPEEKCTMNYCEENGCQNRKRDFVYETLIPDFPTDEPS